MNNYNSDPLIQLFTEGLQSVLPSNFIADLIKIDDDYLWINGHKHKLSKNLKIIAFGKASGTMLDAFVDVIGEKYVSDALLITHMESEYLSKKYGNKIKIVHSSHPGIDESSLMAGKAALEFAHNCTNEDLVVILVSGGGSAMMVYPEDGITFSQKSEYLNTLLLEGIGEREVNVVRKSLSKIKGGKLATKLHPARIINLILSDEREHKINAISSGPTVHSDNNESAIEILKQNMLWEKTPAHIRKNLEFSGNSKNNNDLNIWSQIITGREKMIDELKKLSKKYKYDYTYVLSPLFPSDFDLSVETLVESYNDIYKKCGRGKNLIIGTGEIPIKAIKNGKGGRNQHLAAAIMRKLNLIPKFSFAALATDGCDYIKGYWGAYVDNKIVDYAIKLKLDIDNYINTTDTFHLHEKLGTLVHGEYTGTNVSDFYLLSFEK
jgi:glycerate-2-kinase